MLLKKYKPAIISLVALTIIAAILAFSYFAAPAAKAFALITVEVNPALTLTIDTNEKVVAVELKNDEARHIFTDINLVGLNLKDALKLIADRLDKNGFLGDDDQMFFMVEPASGVSKEAVAGISEKVLVTLRKELESRESQTKLEIVIHDSTETQDEDDVKNFSDATASSNSPVSSAVNINDPGTWDRIIRDAHKDLLVAGFTEAEALDILRNASLINPVSRDIYDIASGFIDMKDVGIPYSVSRNIFAMGTGLDPDVFRREISTLISDFIDMHDVGISSETGLKALLLAISADRTLEEVSTVISGIIDMKEAGVPEAELLSRATLAIQADPTLEDFDDLLNIDDDDIYDDDYNDDKYDDDSNTNDKYDDDYNDDDYNNDDYDDGDNVDDNYDEDNDDDQYDDNIDDDSGKNEDMLN